ncbi:MAG: hypothetical protein PHG43_13525, partial [Phenylobacterium sp.]|nr:hypothetical protein [Phenylobacterium sp.]
MGWGRKALLVTAAAALAGTATAQPANRGPVATYWVSAATATGFGAGMQPGARPSMGQIMGMMGGGGNNVVKTLTLQLGSTRRPAGEPQADHLPPAGLGAGQQLPLLTPRSAPPAPREEPDIPREFQKPRGRMLIFWGCVERARPGQPLVLDFAQMAEGRLPAGLQNLSQVFVSSQNPPSPGRSTTYGEWPNERTRIRV